MSTPQVTTAYCLTCGSPLQVSTSPIMVYVPGEGLQLLPPRLAAPFICEVCRVKPTNLKAAREHMFTYIGQPQTQEGFEG